MRFHIPDMSCGHCTAAITKEIQAHDPGAKLSTDLDTRTVEVATSQADSAVIDAIKTAGYDAASI